MTTNNILIRVEGLKKSFGKVDVLKGVNAEIKKGDVMVVIGPSGSGKSTFLRCLNRLEEPTGGHIYFNDEYFGFDDSFYSAARILKILSSTDKKMSELLAGIEKYEGSPEVIYPVTDETKLEIVEKVK